MADDCVAGRRNFGVGAPHRLGVAAGARREDEHEEIVGVQVDLGHRAASDRRQIGRPLRRVDVENAVGWDGGTQVVQEHVVALLGDDQLAVGMRHVACQLGSATSGVEADDDGAAQRGGAEQHDEVGHIVEEHADMERAVDTPREQEVGPINAFLGVLRPCPPPVFEEQARSLVVEASGDQVTEHH